MTRVVIAPDSFKGSATAAEVAQAIADGWERNRPGDDLALHPMADGGEGTLDALAASQSEAIWHAVEVTGPDGSPTTARWLQLPGGVAAVELAESSGITLMAELDPLHATTYGLGEVLRAVAQENPGEILIGIGGSASTDGGWGALSALGLRAWNADGEPLAHGGAALEGVAHIDRDALVSLPPITLLADVENPLLGDLGAAAVFGPQKGAGPEDIALLDRCLARWSEVLGGDAEAPGAGAAGGVGFGFMAAYGAVRAPGAGHIAEVAGLLDAIDEADVVITGEGKFDASSRHGKVVGHVLEAVHEQSRAPEVIVIAGQIDADVEHGYALAQLAGSADAAMNDPVRWLLETGALAAREYTSRCESRQ